MRESIKALLSLIFVSALFISAIVWHQRDFGPDWLRYVAPPTGLAALILLLKIHRGKDKVPDFLSRISPRFFECNGLSFIPSAVSENGVCQMQLFYQNKYEHPCKATLAIQPAFGFWLDTNDVESVHLNIDCGPAAFGVVNVPWPIPANYQGQQQTFDVSAIVKYPKGRGRILRYRDGIRVGPPKLRRSAAKRLIAVILTLGKLSLAKPAQCTLQLPTDVADVLPIDLSTTSQQYWQLGDQHSLILPGEVQ